MPEISASDANASAKAAISGRRRKERRADARSSRAAVEGSVVKSAHHMGPSRPRRKGRRQADCGSGSGPDGRLVDLAVDVTLELLEVLLEALGDIARGRLVGLLVGPGVLGVEHVARHVGAGAR